MSIFDAIFGGPDIQKLKRSGNVQGLLRALGHTARTRDDTRRLHRGVLDALAEIGEAALQPTFETYLKPKRTSSDRALLVVLREIGRRTEDQRLRLNAAEKLGLLMDLRKENHAAILQALYSLSCLPNLPTFFPAVQEMIRPHLQDPDSAIQAETMLGMLVTSLQMRDFVAIQYWFEKVNTLCSVAPSSSQDVGSAEAAAARRVAAALGEAAPVLTDDFSRMKAVAMLFTLIELWKENQPVNGAVEAALIAYPVTAVPLLLARLEKNPQDTLAVETLEAIGRRMLGSPQETAFLEMIVPYLEHHSWDTRQAAALILHAIGWDPGDDIIRTRMLVAARSFSLSAWSEIQIDRRVIEQLAATIDDTRYPGSIDLVRHVSLLYSQITDREARFRLRGVLARCLQSQPVQVQPYIVRGLAALEWQPGIDSAAVIYWTYLGEWERVVAIATYGANKPETSAQAGQAAPAAEASRAAKGMAGGLSAQPADKTPPGSSPSTSAPVEPAPKSSAYAPTSSSSAAVDVLIECLSSPEISARKTAARALTAIYQSSAIDGQTRSRILATSSRIAEYYHPDSSAVQPG